MKKVEEIAEELAAMVYKDSTAKSYFSAYLSKALHEQHVIGYNMGLEKSACGDGEREAVNLALVTLDELIDKEHDSICEAGNFSDWWHGYLRSLESVKGHIQEYRDNIWARK